VGALSPAVDVKAKPSSAAIVDLIDGYNDTGTGSPGLKKTTHQQVKSPSQPFFSSGGGRNSANYVRGSTPLFNMDSGHVVLDAIQRSDNEDASGQSKNRVENHGSGGVLGANNAGSHSSNRGGRNISLHAMSQAQVQVQQQLEYSARPPALNPVDFNVKSGLKNGPDSMTSYTGLNELVYNKPKVNLPLHAAPVKLVSKFGTRRNVASSKQHVSSVGIGDSRDSSSKSDVVVLSYNVLSEEGIPDKASFLSRIPNGKSSALRKFVETTNGYKSGRSATTSISGIPRRAKLKQLSAIPSIVAPLSIDESGSNLSPVRSAKQLI
jgi:hypothetical protein